MRKLFQQIVSFYKNLTRPTSSYQYRPDAVVVSCFFNPSRSPYRLAAFQKYYRSIQHLEHRIVELAIGDDPFQLPESPYIERYRTDSLLWHKETLLNKAISKLPPQYRFVFWIDADILFTNPDWLVESCLKLENGLNVVQPFQYVIHLNEGEGAPSFQPDYTWDAATMRTHGMWRSYGFNFARDREAIFSRPFDQRGHVGFAWGARRDILDVIPLFDYALIGGGDAVIAYGATGDFNNPGLKEAFTTAELQARIRTWQMRWYRKVMGRLGYADGTILHLWHGDRRKRQYHERAQRFSPLHTRIQARDDEGFYVSTDTEANDYMAQYMAGREVLGDGSFLAAAQTPDPFLFGGGDFGGGGAGGDYSIDSELLS